MYFFGPCFRVLHPPDPVCATAARNFVCFRNGWDGFSEAFGDERYPVRDGGKSGNHSKPSVCWHKTAPINHSRSIECEREQRLSFLIHRSLIPSVTMLLNKGGGCKITGQCRAKPTVPRDLDSWSNRSLMMIHFANDRSGGMTIMMNGSPYTVCVLCAHTPRERNMWRDDNSN